MELKALRYPGLHIGKDRIEALNDGMFAIIMTILVLELTIPAIEVSWGTENLANWLINKFRLFTPYYVSFFVLGIYWLLHHYQFHYIKRVDGVLLWINIIFLLMVALIPFFTLLIGSNDPLANIIYCIDLLIINFILLAHWHYATSDFRLVDRKIHPKAVRLMRNTILIGFPLFLAAIIFSYIDFNLGGMVLNIALWVYFFITAAGAH
jgi:uncharacterized membrane protein